MTAGHYDVVDVLMLVGNLLPLAVYFLVLGLVNSHARPCLITSRSDFVALTGVLVPLVLWPVPDLVRGGHFLVLVAGLIVAAGIFLYMLPGGSAGFVVYNLTRSRCARALEQAAADLGLSGQWLGSTWRADGVDLAVELREFSLLSNVALHVEADSETARRWTPALGEAMNRRFESAYQLPSAMGAGLVVAGLTLMIVPMWMVGRHIDDLVDAMSHLFG